MKAPLAGTEAESEKDGPGRQEGRAQGQQGEVWFDAGAGGQSLSFIITAVEVTWWLLGVGRQHESHFPAGAPPAL